MTGKQKKYMKERISNPTESKKQTALKAGYAESTANVAGKEIEDRIANNEEFKKLMEEKGITDDYLIKKLKEGMNADVVKTATEKGMITDEKTYTDYSTREKYVKLTLETKGRLVHLHDTKIDYDTDKLKKLREWFKD